MNPKIDFWDAVQRIRARDDRFKPEAYAFVMDALEFTLDAIGERRHVKADELLDGLCRYSRDRFGLLAADVLDNWGIRQAFDVGLVVFQLVEAGVLAKQDSDCLEDFDVEFDLKLVLEEQYFD